MHQSLIDDEAYLKIPLNAANNCMTSNQLGNHTPVAAFTQWP